MSAPYLAIVLTGRNDDHGVDFKGRLLRTLRFNHAQLRDRGVPHEIVLVEWAPLPERPLLRTVIEEQVPELAAAGSLRTIVVDPRYQAEMALHPRLQYLEFAAKNVGIRRASAPFVLSTNSDVYLGREVLDAIGRRTLRPRTVYRAARHDLTEGVDVNGVSWDLLQDPASLAAPAKPLQPPLYARGTGDFILADREVWHDLRGFNEIHRASRLGVDRNFLVQAHAAGIAIADIGGPVYHVSHPGSFRVERTEFAGAPPVAEERRPSPGNVLYDNPETWGLAAAPSRHAGAVETIAFDWNAVPPLVNLRAVHLPATL